MGRAHLRLRGDGRLRCRAGRAAWGMATPTSDARPASQREAAFECRAVRPRLLRTPAYVQASLRCRRGYGDAVTYATCAGCLSRRRLRLSRRAPRCRARTARRGRAGRPRVETHARDNRPRRKGDGLSSRGGSPTVAVCRPRASSFGTCARWPGEAPSPPGRSWHRAIDDPARTGPGPARLAADAPGLQARPGYRDIATPKVWPRGIRHRTSSCRDGTGAARSALRRSSESARSRSCSAGYLTAVPGLARPPVPDRS